jgi:hypothetical protein
MAKKPDMLAPINQNAIDALNAGVRLCLEITKQDISQIQPSWARAATAAYLLIHLHDVLRILDRAGHRLTWTEDLSTDQDVTSQVKIIRDGMCHI